MPVIRLGRALRGFASSSAAVSGLKVSSVWPVAGLMVAMVMAGKKVVISLIFSP